MGTNTLQNLHETLRSYEIELQGNHIADVTAESRSQINHVVMLVNQATSEESVCPKCCKLYNNELTICPQCSHVRNLALNRSVLYGCIPSNHPKDLPKIGMGEIIAVNPNSHESVKTVLHELKNTEWGWGELPVGKG